MAPKRVVIRDHSAEANLFARRALIAMIVITMMAGALLFNLYHLQVTRYDDYQTRSNGNRIKVLPVPPNRGLIYDRNGVLLAENKPVFSLQIVPNEVKDLNTTVSELAQLLSISESNVEDFYKDYRRQRRFKPVTLLNRLSKENVALFSAQQHRFPGVSIEARLTRHYPFGDTFTHVLGYVAKINQKDLKKLQEAGQEANYAATYDIGKLGIEKYHENILHGQVGSQEVEVNNQGRIIRTLNFVPPVPGKDITLNIDVKLQQVAQKALENNRGAVVVLDARDGGVMALYSNPAYDPNLFVHGISSKNYRGLLNSPDKPLINRATQGQYPPASTVKPHLALLGLEKNYTRLNSTIFDRGVFRLKNVSHKWRDWLSWGHGHVNVTTAIEVSCDTYFYDLAYRMGIDEISGYMAQFGFGEYSGLDLYEESSAILPSRGWKKARMNEPWYMGDTIVVGIGQGPWTATPVQLASSVAALVNHGKRFVPQIYRGIYQEGQTIVAEPKTRAPIEIKDVTNWHIVLDAMYGVNHREQGTARKVFSDAPYVSAGKTGTAQLVSIAQGEKYDADKLDERHRDNAMYVGYAPYDAPEIVVAVAVENAGSGSAEAGPVARMIMDQYFATDNVTIAQNTPKENHEL
ncbi:penicillin-binding protein 2 [Planctobacterium marinum]|uniref:Peptidoglycan D,D-transpeptidase MrdA n=1 Tax=Planctobacterium marinum TaxID=1631968 RepID=A0AA48HM12_9ALTE|nr:penicillin-binding protein 2 [Planctobacterium marinum]